MFSSVSKNVFSKIKGAASVVGEKVQTGAEVAASALGVAGNFLQANTLQPALMASTAGGLGAGGALGIGAIGGAATPMQDVSEHTATLQPALMASTAGGLGAGGALGIGALGGATSPMQDVSEHTASMSDGIETMNEKLADLVGNGLDVQVLNHEGT